MPSITAAEKALFIRLLSQLLKSGKTPTEAVHALMQEQFSEPLQRQLDKLASRETGFPDIKSILKLPLFCLDDATLSLFDKAATTEHKTLLLGCLIEQYSQEESIDEMGIGMMAYLLPISAAIVGIAAITVYKVFPAFHKFYSDFGADLPPPIDLFMRFGNLILFFLIALVLFIFLVRYEKFNDAQWVQWIKLRGPWGKSFKKIAVARFLRMLAIHLPKELSLDEKIALSISASGNRYVAEMLQKKKATLLTVYLQSIKEIPESCMAAFRIGEKLGSFSEFQQELVRFTDNFLFTNVRQRNVRMSILLTTAVAVFCASMIYSVYMPIFQIGNIL